VAGDRLRVPAAGTGGIGVHRVRAHGEVAVILGGVAARRGTVPLWAVIMAAVAVAVDSAGYLIGRRWGEAAGSSGRVPVIRRPLDKHLEAARAYRRTVRDA